MRLARQFVTEGLLLALAGCLAGLCVGAWVMALMSRMIPKDMAASVPFLRLVGLNRHTGTVCGGDCAACGVVCWLQRLCCGSRSRIFATD